MSSAPAAARVLFQPSLRLLPMHAQGWACQKKSNESRARRHTCYTHCYHSYVESEWRKAWVSEVLSGYVLFGMSRSCQRPRSQTREKLVKSFFPFGQAKPSYGSSANNNTVRKFEHLWTIDLSVKKLTNVASFSGIFAVWDVCGWRLLTYRDFLQRLVKHSPLCCS